jgi:hypothetical protein
MMGDLMNADYASPHTVYSMINSELHEQQPNTERVGSSQHSEDNGTADSTTPGSANHSACAGDIKNPVEVRSEDDFSNMLGYQAFARIVMISCAVGRRLMTRPSSQDGTSDPLYKSI